MVRWLFIILITLMTGSVAWGAACSSDPYTSPNNYFSQVTVRLNGTTSCFLGLNNSEQPTIRLVAYANYSSQNGVMAYVYKNNNTFALDTFTINGVSYSSGTYTLIPLSTDANYTLAATYTYDNYTYSITAVFAFSGTKVTLKNTNLTVNSLNTAPVLGSIGNQSNASDVALSLNVTATDVDNDTLSYSATGLPTGLSINSSTGTISGTPTTPGSYSSTITVSDGTVTDSETITWTITGPQLSSSTPSSGSSSLKISDPLLFNFSVPIYPQNGYITIKKSSDDSLIERIDVSSSRVSGSGTTQITVTPSVWLDPNTAYYIQIDSTAFENSVGSRYSGISDNTTLAFTTGNSAVDPRTQSTVVAEINRQPAVVVQLAEKALRPVVHRLTYLRTSSGNKSSASAQPKFQIHFSDPTFNRVASTLQSFNNMYWPSYAWDEDTAIWTAGELTLGRESNRHLDSVGQHLLKTQTFSVGVDRHFYTDLAAGFAFQTALERAYQRDNDSMNKTASYSLTGYSQYRWHHDAYFQIALGASWLNLDLKRVHDTGTLHGDRDGLQGFIHLTAHWDSPIQLWRTTPYVHLRASTTRLSGYREFGTNAALHYYAQRIHEGSYGLGLHVEPQNTIQLHQWHPRLDLLYEGDLHSNTVALTEYVIDPGTFYRHRYDVNPEGSLRFSLGGDWKWSPYWMLQVDVDHRHQKKKGYSYTTRLQIQRQG